MVLISTSTGAVCFNASNQAPNPSGKIMAASGRSHGPHYAPDVSRELRDPCAPGRLRAGRVGAR